MRSLGLFLADFYRKAGLEEGRTPFHQIIANSYSRCRNQYTPWHSDASELLAKDTDILSISLGSAGIFCFAPNERGGTYLMPVPMSTHAVLIERASYPVLCAFMRIFF